MSVGLDSYIRATYPLIVVETFDPVATERRIRGIVDKISMLVEAQDGRRPNDLLDIQDILSMKGQVSSTITALVTKPKWTIFVMRNIHFVFQDKPVIQAIHNFIRSVRDSDEPKILIGMCPSVDSLPPELERDGVIIRDSLPEDGELLSFTKDMAAKYWKKTQTEDGVVHEVARIGRGLTLAELERAVKLSIVQNKEIQPSVIAEVKKQIIRQSAALKLYQPLATDKLENLAGMANMKHFVERTEAQGRGILIMGPPGCLHGSTPIHDPVDNTDYTVKERWSRGVSFHVVAKTDGGEPVIAEAEPPHQYPEEPMVKLSFSDGESIIVTLGHRIMVCCDVWRSAYDLSKAFLEQDEVYVASVDTTKVCVSINDIEDAGVHEYYDFHVPVYENYAACGVWNHNTGKTQFAKNVAAKLGIPLLVADIGSVFHGLVGSSEANMRRMIATVEAFGRCVLLVDELEKAFAGASGGSGDSGTTQRTLSKFLTWLSDRKTLDAYVVATCNAMTLPPEYIRAGRFSTIFYLGFPAKDIRANIWSIWERNFGLPGNEPYPEDSGWTGAEIFQCCELAKDMRVSLMEAAEYVTHVGKVAKGDLDKLRDFAANAGLVPADDVEDDVDLDSILEEQ